MALPSTLNPARPSGTDSTNDPASTLDNQIRDLKQLLADLFGIPVDPTSLTAAIMSVTAAGLVSALRLGTAAPATPVANTLYTDKIVNGVLRTSGAGAWTIDFDVNVSSITDNGTGDFTINWATAFANANYAVVGIIRGTTLTGIQGHSVMQDTATEPLTTAVRCMVVGQSAGAGVEYELAKRDPGVGVYVIAVGAQ